MPTKKTTTDPNVIDFDEPVNPKRVEKTAKKTFRLADKVQGIKHRHGTVPLFLDLEAVDNYQTLNRQAQIINDAAGKVDLKADGGPEQHQQLLDEYNRLEPLVEEAKAAMLASTLSVHLHAWPNIAAKVARREARKRFGDPALGGVPADRVEEANNYVDMQLLGASIVKIVDAEGAEDTLQPYDEPVTDDDGNPVMKKGQPKMRRVIPRQTIGQTLSDDLPPSQWVRLYDAYQKLTLTDALGELATDDPGF